jgi:hypothetical protein
MAANVCKQHLHFGDSFHLFARNPVSQIAHTGVVNISFPSIVNGDGVMWDHRFHERGRQLPVCLKAWIGDS